MRALRVVKVLAVLAFVLLGVMVGQAVGQERELMGTAYIHYPPITTSIEPTGLHRFIYREMERCSGKSGDFDKIVWNTAAWIAQVGSLASVAAYWVDLVDGRRAIWVRADLWNNPTILSHESLHDLAEGQFTVDQAQTCEIRQTGVQ